MNIFWIGTKPKKPLTKRCCKFIYQHWVFLNHRPNVSKHKYIKGSDKYVTLDISLKFDSLDKIKITSSESKGKQERSGMGLITSMGFKAKVRPQNTKRQGIPQEMSIRRTFLRLLGSLRHLRNYLMRKRGPNMSLLKVTFT